MKCFKHVFIIIINILVHNTYCIGTGQGWDLTGCPMPSRLARETEWSRPLEAWPRDRVAETFGDLAERSRP